MNPSSSTSMNNDEAFMSLLSSQRELLHRLNMESAMRREHEPTNATQFNKRKRDSMHGNQDALSLMNMPIAPPPSERRGGIDMLFSRRLSMGLGGNDFFGMSGTVQYISEEEKPKELDLLGSKKMKRRRSSLGLLSSMIFDDQQKLPSRRLSMLSTFSGASLGFADSFDQEFVFDNPDPLPEAKSVKLDPNLPVETVRSNLSSFATSMDKSTKSQQDIHAWDRKMGLKRSHSKTMRMTMRSRKKLRSMLKKDINSLVQAH